MEVILFFNVGDILFLEKRSWSKNGPNLLLVLKDYFSDLLDYTRINSDYNLRSRTQVLSQGTKCPSSFSWKFSIDIFLQFISQSKKIIDQDVFRFSRVRKCKCFFLGVWRVDGFFSTCFSHRWEKNAGFYLRSFYLTYFIFHEKKQFMAKTFSWDG